MGLILFCKVEIQEIWSKISKELKKPKRTDQSRHLSQPARPHTITWANQGLAMCATRTAPASASATPATARVLRTQQRPRARPPHHKSARVARPLPPAALPSGPNCSPLPISAHFSALVGPGVLLMPHARSTSPCLCPLSARHVSANSKAANKPAACGKLEVKISQCGNQAQAPNLSN